MGQKVSPTGLRIGVIRNWESRWYADKDYAKLLHEDIKIRDYLNTYYKTAAVSRIDIERDKSKVKVAIFTAKPGMVIGREGSIKNAAVKHLEKFTGKKVYINIIEINRPELDATLVAKSIAEQLENRGSFRRVQKMAIQRTMRAGAKGVKTLVAGRLGGAEMARSEGYSEGNVPLQTLRADIDYATAEANTTYGKLGVKVWIYKGEVLGDHRYATPEARPKKRKDNRNRNNKNNRNNNYNRGNNNNNNRPNNRQGGTGARKPQQNREAR